jgi:hypothetical protein
MLNKILLFLSSVQFLFHIQATLTSIAVFLVVFSHTNVIHASKRVSIITEICYCILRKAGGRGASGEILEFGHIFGLLRHRFIPAVISVCCTHTFRHPTAKYRQAVGSAEENNFK